MAGLPRTEHPGFAAEFAQLVAVISAGGRSGDAGTDQGAPARSREGAE